ncbi:hypothetical protein UCRPC4_g05221 [Phaeomoniella chlamydospora]|uniref:Uncharacterized protein n=1 Tax=Phaeomoniella chlamydospora TaxID=158046 RepID=A0A0G2G299_PHACM|nr:hypothetical protein UCRPC4_g05221 [Phaeomoniella chlamydospora]
MDTDTNTVEIQTASPIQDSDMTTATTGMASRKRRNDSISSPLKSTICQSTGLGDEGATIVNNGLMTPSRTRQKKRTRFSDPGPSMAESTTPTKSTRTASTGLTPFVGRANISTPSTSRRRRSAPTTCMGTPHQINVTEYNYEHKFSTFSGEMQFTPVRQVLDERKKRQIKRHGLSEEFNNIQADKRQKDRLLRELEAKDAMLESMKQELKRKSANEQENDLAHPNDVGVPASTTQSMLEVEEEPQSLRRSMQEANGESNVDTVPNSINETAAADVSPRTSYLATGGDKAAFPIHEDEETMTEPFDSESIYQDAQSRAGSRDASTSADLPDLRQGAEMLTMALDLEAEKRDKRELFKEWRHQFSRGLASTGFHFSDAPSIESSNNNSFTRSLPSPPPNFLQQVSSNLKSMTARAEDAELALCVLETELKSTGFEGEEGSEIIADIKRQCRSARLEFERIIPGETSFGLNSNHNLLPEILKRVKGLMRHVRDREAELRSLNEQHRSLKGNFDHALLSLADANQKIRDLEETVDSNVEELLESRMRVQELEREVVEKEETSKYLREALDKYRKEVMNMEQLITKMEAEEPFKIQAAQEHVQNAMEEATGDLRNELTAEEQRRHSAEELSAQRKARLDELQHSFDLVSQHAAQVQVQLDCLSAEKEEEEFKLRKRIHESGEQHQVHLGSLNTKIADLSTALSAARDEVDRLKASKDKLESRLVAELGESERAVEAMQHDFIRGVAKANERKKSYLRGAKIRYANSEIEEEEMELTTSSPATSSPAPMTPVGHVRFADVEFSRGKGKSRRRRNYDSGIGMSSDMDSNDLSVDILDSDDLEVSSIE